MPAIRSGLAAALLAASLASPALADEYAGFRIPDNGYRLWTLGLTGAANWSHATFGSEASAHGEERAGLSTRITRQHETDTRFGGLDGAISVTGDVIHTAQSGPALSGDHHESPSAERASLLATQRWYFEHSRWFLGASGFGTLGHSQDLDRDSRDTRDPGGPVTRVRSWSSGRTGTYSSTLFLSFGPGWGRVRNATSVFETQVLESRLRTAGALTHPLSNGARQRLAELLYARNDAAAAYERPASRLWASLEQILRDDGALSDRALEARNLFRVVEPYLGPSASLDATGLPRSPIERRIGWSLSADLNLRVERRTHHYAFAFSQLPETLGVAGAWSENRDGSTFRSAIDGTGFSLGGDYHRPLNARLQWDSNVSYQFSPRHDQKGYTLQAGADIGWCIADRWLVAGSVDHFRQLSRDGDNVTGLDIRSSSLSGMLQYFVTDHLAARLDASEDWEKGASLSSSEDEFRNGGNISFGLTYRFSGDARIADVFPAGGVR